MFDLVCFVHIKVICTKITTYNIKNKYTSSKNNQNMWKKSQQAISLLKFLSRSFKNIYTNSSVTLLDGAMTDNNTVVGHHHDHVHFSGQKNQPQNIKITWEETSQFSSSHHVGQK